MIQKLFEQQKIWLQAQDPIKEISKITGIKLELCRHAVQSEPLKDAVFMKRLQAEKELTIDGTPTFVINGRIIDHAPTLEVLESYIGLQPSKQDKLERH
jgi:predicted DsbA family dithiol-disulfide isomerase